MVSHEMQQHQAKKAGKCSYLFDDFASLNYVFKPAYYKGNLAGLNACNNVYNTVATVLRKFVHFQEVNDCCCVYLCLLFFMSRMHYYY